MSSTEDRPATTISPFGAPARRVLGLSTRRVRSMYRSKCGVDVQPFLGEIEELELFECAATGMRFWRPEAAAGPEELYRLLSASWPNYYRTDRWEYAHARDVIGSGKRVLEVGCGRGYFLRSLEARGNTCVGLELNRRAIAHKVAAADVRRQFVEEFAAAEPAAFDVVCSFQVLEHVVDPASFIRACAALVRRGGLLILSTPDNDFALHRALADAFDLPPHHVNQFTAVSFARIAEHLDLPIVEVRTQTVPVARRALPVDPDMSAVTRVLRRSANLALRLAAGTQPGPGHTLLAIFRVPPASPA